MANKNTKQLTFSISKKISHNFWLHFFWSNHLNFTVFGVPTLVQVKLESMLGFHVAMNWSIALIIAVLETRLYSFRRGEYNLVLLAFSMTALRIPKFPIYTVYCITNTSIAQTGVYAWTLHSSLITRIFRQLSYQCLWALSLQQHKPLSLLRFHNFNLSSKFPLQNSSKHRRPCSSVERTQRSQAKS